MKEKKKKEKEKRLTEKILNLNENVKRGKKEKNYLKIFKSFCLKMSRVQIMRAMRATSQEKEVNLVVVERRKKEAKKAKG